MENKNENITEKYLLDNDYAKEELKSDTENDDTAIVYWKKIKSAIVVLWENSNNWTYTVVSKHLRDVVYVKTVEELNNELKKIKE